MTCDDFQRQLHLSRDGELTPDELEGLRRHIASCERCTAEQATIEGAERLLNGVRLTYPSPRDPEALTARIMLGIRSGTKPFRSAQFSLLEQALQFMAQPVIRYGYATVVVLAVGLFLFQSYSLFTNVDSLQERLASGDGAGIARMAYVIEEDDVRTFPWTHRLREYASVAGIRMDQGKVIVDRQSVASALARTSQGRLLIARPENAPVMNDEYQDQLRRFLRKDISTRLLFKRGGL